MLLQILRRTTRLKVTNEALFKIAELMAYAMFVNLFLFGAEVFRDFYSSTREVIHYQYLFGTGRYGTARRSRSTAGRRCCAASPRSSCSSSRRRGRT